MFHHHSLSLLLALLLTMTAVTPTPFHRGTRPIPFRRGTRPRVPGTFIDLIPSLAPRSQELDIEDHRAKPMNQA